MAEIQEEIRIPEDSHRPEEPVRRDGQPQEGAETEEGKGDVYPIIWTNFIYPIKEYLKWKSPIQALTLPLLFDIILLQQVQY